MKKGFTLAEVLITLGIVGVIAVLTVPSVMQDYKNKLYATQLKKVYLDISNAMQQVMNDEHVDKFYLTKVTIEDPENIKYFLSNYFTYSKLAKCTQYSNCQNSLSSKNYKYENISGEEIPSGLFGPYGIKTKYGAIIVMHHTTGTHELYIDVDVNGEAAPNIAGRDAFTFKIGKDSNELTDAWPKSEQCNQKTGEWQNITSYAAGCAQSIIENNWTMNY